MADTIKIEDIEERVVLVGVSEQDGDAADDSLSELAELVKAAGATVAESCTAEKSGDVP